MSAFNNRPEFPEAPVSPCVSICALDGDDICVGCFRTGREISYWGLLPVEERREVLVRCQQPPGVRAVSSGPGPTPLPGACWTRNYDDAIRLIIDHSELFSDLLVHDQSVKI